MLFALICTDKPDSVDLRMSVRPDHVAFLQGLGYYRQYKAEDLAQAVTYFKKAIELDPNNKSYKTHLKQLQELQKQ